MKSGNNKYFQLIPEKVNNLLWALEQLIDIKGYNRDCLKEVLSIVALHVRKDEEATPLKMTYLKRLVPQGDKYMAALINLGVIERSGYYIPGQVAYNYKFTPQYESKYLSFALTNASLIRRIELAQETIRKEAAKSIRGRSEQVTYLKQLTIADNFDDFIKSHYANSTDQYNAVLSSATRILNGDTARCSVDDTSGRFHSIVTNMAKGLRPYLRIKGEPLANIDIKNSQPYLSTIILTNPGKVSHMTKNHAFTMLLQTLKYKDIEDVKKYIYLVANGQLYEYLMQQFEKAGLSLTRAETKRQVLRILFARNRTPKDETNKKCRQVFRDCFPTVHRIFSKVRGHEPGDKFTNFKRFAILLQRIEAFLMLDVILKRIYKELPGTIAVTVHDSIMTGVLTNNVAAVRKIMEEELTLFVGFRPQIEVEGNDQDGKGKGEIIYTKTNMMLQTL